MVMVKKGRCNEIRPWFELWVEGKVLVVGGGYE
jgi:hypothetical protein